MCRNGSPLRVRQSVPPHHSAARTCGMPPCAEASCPRHGPDLRRPADAAQPVRPPPVLRATFTSGAPVPFLEGRAAEPRDRPSPWACGGKERRRPPRWEPASHGVARTGPGSNHRRPAGRAPRAPRHPTNEFLVSVSNRSPVHRACRAAADGLVAPCLSAEIALEYEEVFAAHMGRPADGDTFGECAVVDGAARVVAATKPTP